MIAFKQLCQRCGWRRFAIWLGFVTLAVLMGISERATSQVSGEKPYPFALAVRRSIEEWGLWGLVGLAVIWFARRQPLQEGRLGRWLALHAAGSIVVAVSYVVVYAAMMHGQTSVDGTVLLFPKFVVKLLVWHSQFCLLIYWMIVVADHAIVSYRNFREGERRAAELQAQLVEARLDALRMQINPHFLFNTLHTISALIHEKPEVADRMLVRLSELLRLTLERNDSHQVPLAQELGFLERYLEIEQARFDERLKVDFAVEPFARDALVPWLILQPLVENAIRHGIEPREEGGHIAIQARRADGRLELIVADNGNGLPNDPPSPVREGIGLGNTRSRLAHLYAGDHQFELRNGSSGGLEVRIAIPFRANAAVAAPLHAG